MELWIRSQDKTFLKKVNTIGIVEGQDFCFISENITTDLGKYKSKERALEVLDEIQNKLMPISVYKQEVDNLTIDFKNIDTIVYEMPKD